MRMIVTAEEMIEAWGKSGLIQYDPPAVARVSIPEESKKFLVEIGLPRWNGEAILYGVPNNHLPPLSSILPHNLAHRADYGHYRVLGIGSQATMLTGGQSYDEAFNYVCLDEYTDGRVVLITNELGMLHIFFLNSSVLHLAKFLLLEHERNQWLEQAEDRWDGEALRTLGRRIVKEMHEIDPAACARGSAWKQILVTFEYGV
ncbi:MAG: immunity protein [Chthonomonadaceae bacterium]|nr:immunity protein [Chthonomonadaceae bacterium]